MPGIIIETMKNIAIFASGSGTNAENIIKHFENNKNILVKLVCSNKNDAYVLERAKKHQIETFVFTNDALKNSRIVLDKLKEKKIDFIVLAGFMRKIPQDILTAYNNKVINIHPALLPKFGGQGMYGDKVHKAVIESGEKLSGITIHYVNENYDEGAIIFQATCPVSESDTPGALAEKVHALEYTHYPKIIEEVVLC